MPRLNQTAKQARELKNMAFELAKQLMESPDDETLKEQARALDALVRAWENACERERIAMNKPLPGSIRRVESKKSRAPKMMPIEPLCPAAAQGNGS